MYMHSVRALRMTFVPFRSRKPARVRLCAPHRPGGGPAGARATDSRLEREKTILREKRRREEKAAAAKERIRRVAEEKEARRRQLVRSFVCPVMHSSIRRSFFTVQSLPVTFIPPLHTKRRLPRRRRR